MLRLILFLPILLPLFTAAQDDLLSGWAVQFGGATADEVTDVAVDGAGNTYAVGWFTGTADFDPGPGTLELVSAGQFDAFVMKLDTLGQPVWVHRFGGQDFDIARRVVVDDAGDVFVFGEFQATVDFDPGPGEEILMAGPWTSRAFVLKLTGDGDLVWVKALGQFTTAASMRIDGAGSIYLGGFFEMVTDLDPGPDVLSFTSFGGFDGYVVKLNSVGELVWARRIGGPAFDTVNDIALDGQGGLLLTGGFTGTMEFDPGPGSFIMHAPGADRRDVFVSRWDTSGTLVWARQFASSMFNTIGASVTSDPWGNVITTGYFSGSVDFDPGPETLIYSGTWEVFVNKLDPNGDLLWSLQFDNATNSHGHRVITDPAGNIFVAGTNHGSIDMDPGPGTAILPSESDIVNSAFLLKLDPDGIYLNSAGITGDGHAVAYSLALDADDNVRLCGSFLGTADFDPGLDTLAMTSHGDKDGWIVTLGGCSVDEDPMVELSGTTLTTDAPGPFFQWVDCITGEPIPDATAAVFEAPGTGSYAVEAGTIYCMPVSECVDVISTGISTDGHAIGISIFPNPVNDVLTIQLDHWIIAAETRLVDMRGGIIRDEHMFTGDRSEMNVAGIASGVYLLEVRSADRIHRVMVVKQ
jgi:hypothetical protein